MKEIRAYIRRDEVNDLVEKLRAAGAPGVSLIEIHPLGYGYEANPFEGYRAGIVARYRYLTIVKLEIVCADAQVERLIRVIEDQCRRGIGGDGMILVSEVVEAVRIRDGARGEAALVESRVRTARPVGQAEPARRDEETPSAVARPSIGPTRQPGAPWCRARLRRIFTEA